MVPFSSRRVPSLPSFSSRPAFPIPSCHQQGFKCLTTGWRPQRAACCCKELGVAALRLAHNVAGLPPQRDNLGHSQVRVSSQHPAQLTAFSRRENLARPVGCQNRRPARWRPTLTVLQTQPKGGSASCGGNFKTQHHNTLTLLGIFILDTMAPHIRKYVTRLYCWSARSFQRAPPLRRWQLGFVIASAATCQGGWLGLGLDAPERATHFVHFHWFPSRFRHLWRRPSYSGSFQGISRLGESPSRTGRFTSKPHFTIEKEELKV